MSVSRQLNGEHAELKALFGSLSGMLTRVAALVDGKRGKIARSAPG
ncbi:hypothetical protein [Nonomuraea sp. NPDC050643]